MRVVDRLLEVLEERLRRRAVVDVRVGLGYTGVLLDDGAMGVAYTFRHSTPRGCTVVARAGSLTGQAWDRQRRSVSRRSRGVA